MDEIEQARGQQSAKGQASGETVTVEFSVALGVGKFAATAVVPAGQTNLTQILPVIQSLDDSLIAGITAQLGEAGHQVSCRAGCAACCRQLVALSIFEAEALAEWIGTLALEQQHALARRFDEALRKYAGAGLIDRMVNEDWLANSGASRQLALDYFAQYVACPFLENELCSIHPIRPLNCREYMVISPPELCDDPAALNPTPAPMPMNFFRSLTQIGAELENDHRGWIPLLFLFAWMKAGAHPGQRVSGDGPQVLYEFVKNIRPSLAVTDMEH